MNRTVALFAVAASLALVALLVGPKPATAPPPPTPVSPSPPPVTPTVVTAPPVSSTDALSLSARVSHPVIPVGPSEVFVTADVLGRSSQSDVRSPVDLALVIDRSGSMEGEKLRYAKQAAEALVLQLTEKDRLAVIDYGSNVRVLPSQFATSANRESMISWIRRIEDDGGTNTYAALADARGALKAHGGDAIRRVILISDGIPTEGITDGHRIAELAHGFHQQGISVSAIGVGADFNEDLMSSIAELGSGSYGYLRDTRELASLFRRDLQQASHMVARNVTVSFTLPEGARLEQVYGREFSRHGNTVDVSVPDISAGQLERVVMRLSVSGERAGEKLTIANVDARFEDAETHKSGDAQVALASTVTENRQEVVAHLDKDATVAGARAESAKKVSEAAEYYRRGDTGGAMALMQKAKEALAPAAAVAPGAVAQDLQAQAKTLNMFGTNASDEEREDAVKSAKRDARKGMGSLSSTY